MNDMPRHSARQLTIEQPSDTETLVRHTFDAAAERVFDLWTTPELVRRWWPLPSASMTECEIDLRPGGRWRWVLSHPDWPEVAYSGQYREVDRPRRLAFSERFEAMPGSEYECAIAFSEKDGRTTVTTHFRYTSLQHRDGHMQANFVPGLTGAYARMDEVLAGSRNK